MSLSSIFGGGGDAGQGAMNSAMGALGSAGGYASGLGGLGQGALNSIYNPNLAPWLQNQQAVGQYYAGLGQHGMNANQQATYLGQFGDYTSPYTQAQSQSAAANAQRGFGALSGGANSVSGSSSNYIAAQQAANMQSRLSQMGQYQTQMQPQWMQQAANAYFQPVQFGSGLGMQGLGQAANINLGQAQQYAGIGAEQFQQQMQQNQLLGQGLGSILGLGGQMYGTQQYLNALKGMGLGGNGGGGGGGLGSGSLPNIAVGADTSNPTVDQLVQAGYDPQTAASLAGAGPYSAVTSPLSPLGTPW